MATDTILGQPDLGIRTWAYEVAACCISAITLAGVVILLWTRQNKPLPDWPALITLNSIIAVLTTIMKGSMIFAVAEGISQLKWSWFLRPRSLADLSTYDSASRGHRRIVQPMAVTCKMWPTLKTYNAYIESGNLIETEIQTRDVPSWEKLDRHLVDGTWHNCTGTPSPTATNTIGLRNGTTILDSHDLGIIANNLAPLNVSYWSPSCTVQMGPMIFSQYREFLANMFTVKVPGRADTPQQGVMGSMRTQNQTVGNQMHLAAFLNEGKADLDSITRYMEALSGSLSAYMRTTANVTEAGLDRERGEWVGLMKSSPLALMLYGPREEGFYEYDGPKDAVMLEVRAERIRTTLERKLV
ncbi:hypothetical protein KVT40_000345 [Elsinoe batatas]|uniref:Uncharacterized protein n=1 Tax=Elsinoe batatas TaxID=2601811 RepID=A0A8K0L9E5_9PEZI|nr:hypothetical protein KVT40_000345 [Elsinoe batatas]